MDELRYDVTVARRTDGHFALWIGDWEHHTQVNWTRLLRTVREYLEVQIRSGVVREAIGPTRITGARRYRLLGTDAKTMVDVMAMAGPPTELCAEIGTLVIGDQVRRPKLTPEFVAGAF